MASWLIFQVVLVIPGGISNPTPFSLWILGSFIRNIFRMHTGGFIDLCLDDLLDDQARLGNLCDQLALASGLRLSFTYGSIQYANEMFLVIETNSPNLGFMVVFFTTLTSCFDLIVVLMAVMYSVLLNMLNSEEQMLYLTLSCKAALRIPLQCFWAASYIFAFAFLTESYILAMEIILILRHPVKCLQSPY